MLVQVGLLDPRMMPAVGLEQAKALLDPSLPLNSLIKTHARVCFSSHVLYWRREAVRMWVHRNLPWSREWGGVSICIGKMSRPWW